jgi:hypothetical protein
MITRRATAQTDADRFIAQRAITIGSAEVASVSASTDAALLELLRDHLASVNGDGSSA